MVLDLSLQIPFFKFLRLIPLQSFDVPFVSCPPFMFDIPSAAIIVLNNNHTFQPLVLFELMGAIYYCQLICSKKELNCFVVFFDSVDMFYRG